MSSPSSQKQLNSPNARCDNDSVSLLELKKTSFWVTESETSMLENSYGKLKSGDKIKANVYFAWMAREVPKVNGIQANTGANDIRSLNSIGRVGSACL
ncbi:hypothetical protein Tco_0414819 [Tanacetum coccineum]